jgi:osmotically-inducible protein OsmY
MKTDTQLTNDINEELKLHQLAACKLNIVVNDAYVKILGTVDSYTKKILAERTVKNVEGVKELFSEIKVILPGTAEKKTPAKLAKSLLIGAMWRIRN